MLIISFFLMTFNYEVIEIFIFVHSWKKWEGSVFLFSVFFLEKTGGISSEMGEPKLTAYLWYERKKKMTTQEQEGRMHVISSESKVAKNQKYSCRLQIPGISK